jgi:hypothetical protein
MSKKGFLLTSFIVVLGLVGSAAAADKTWTGAVSTDWFDANNWEPVGVPERGWDEYTGDIVHINGTATNFPVINTTDPCATCKQLLLGSVADSEDAYLTIEDGGELTVRSYDPNAGNQTIVLGQKNGTHGIINMTGGTINMAPFDVEAGVSGEQMEIGGRYSSGDGTFNMTGGQFNNGKINLTGYGGTGTGVLNLDGGIIDCNGYSMSGSMFGTLNIYDGGMFITDFLNCWDGYKVNLYGGVIDSGGFRFIADFTQMDFCGGIWKNRSQISGNDESTWTVRYYATNINTATGEPWIVAYGGRGTVVIESFPYVPGLPEDQWEGFQVYADFDANIAYWPNPENGFGAADMEQTLSWYPGYDGNAAYHDVYFGTDFNDVNNATLSDPCGVYVTRLPAETNSISRLDYWPTPLVMGTTYYWRIDEVNDSEFGSPWKGTVWSFSISYVSIDDFESYSNDAELKVEWKDNSDPENPTWCYAFSRGSASPDHALDSRSMYLTCMNGFQPFYYSEVWHNFAQPQDWSPAGTDARLLALSYYGLADNKDAGMYVKLKDSLGAESTQWISKDPDTCKVESWTEALLSLKDFGGIDLSKVSRITIGVGLDPAVATGFVEIWIDNVRLYLPGCHPNYLRAAGDINADCITDFDDLEQMAVQWLSDEPDVEVDLYFDGGIDFKDCAVLGQTWLETKLFGE